MSRTYFRNDDDSLSTMETIAFASKHCIEEFEDKEEVTSEESLAYYENLAELDLVYTHLAHQSGERVYNLAEIAQLAEGKSLNTPGSLLAAKSVVERYSPLSIRMEKAFGGFKLFVLPFMLFVITGNWFGSTWNLLSNGAVISLILWGILSQVLMTRELKLNYSIWLEVKEKAESYRQLYLEKKVNSDILEKWWAIRQRNPDLIPEE